jgi:hypothetical protein
MLRMGAGVMVLAILLISIWRARDPRNWQWLIGAGNASTVIGEKSETPAKKSATKPKGKQAARTPEPPPSPTQTGLYGLTDEDPEQRDAAREEFEAVSDGNLKLAKEEIEAYDRLVFWVKNQTFAQLWKRGRKNPSYSYLYDGAEDRRGQIMALDVTVRLVHDAGENRDDVPLHEAWSVTSQSRDRLYDLIVLDFPSEIPQDKYIREKARFAGYFLKLQGYQPALAKRGQSSEKAPLLIGRLDWAPDVAAETDAAVSADWPGGVLLAAIVVILGLLAGLFFMLRRLLGGYSSPPASLLKPPAGGAMSIEEWLDRPQEPFAEDSPEDTPDSREDKTP